MAEEDITYCRTQSDLGGSGWPDVLLVRVPPAEHAADLARQVRRDVLGIGSEDQPIVDLRPLLKAGRFSLRHARLFGREGGLQALLAPRPNNRFSIEVDAEPAGGWGRFPAGLRAEVELQRLRFRVCHEIG